MTASSDCECSAVRAALVSAGSQDHDRLLTPTSHAALGRTAGSRRLILQRHLRGLSGIMLCVVLEMAAGELGRLHELIAGRFARAEPRARVRAYVSGLVAGLERKSGWTLAEQAGELSPDGM